MTLIVAPRGLGKTHVAAHARGGLFLSQQLAKLRVAYIDRDNPRRELRRRGTRWGWSGAGEYLRVLTRMDAPPLTDRAWLMFPFADYDVVIIDSVSSSTEGVDESSGGDSGAALAPLLEFSIRPGGRQVTALGRKDHGTPFL
jgi:hypothetical protein